MANFRFTAEIMASPQRVWAVWMDVDRWPEWTPTVTRVESLDDGPLAVGSRAKIWQPKLIPAVWQVTELRENHGVFAWKAHRPGIAVTATHQVSGIDDMSLVVLELDYRGILGPVMAWSLKDLNWRYLTQEANGLKQRCEQMAAHTALST